MKRIAAIVLILSLGACSSQTKEAEPLPAAQYVTLNPDTDAAAIAFLKVHEGKWNSRWEWFDAEGKIIGGMAGVEEFIPGHDGYSQTLQSYVPEFDQRSQALIAYSPIRQNIRFVSVGAQGDGWVMYQDPMTGTMISEPHLNPDGTMTTLRFTTLESSPDAMKIQMESSTDGGETWAVLFHQYMTRAAD